MLKQGTIAAFTIFAGIATIAGASALALPEAPAPERPAKIGTPFKAQADGALYAVPAPNDADCYIVHQRVWNETRARFVKERRKVCV